VKLPSWEKFCTLLAREMSITPFDSSCNEAHFALKDKNSAYSGKKLFNVEKVKMLKK